jgi:hypothetical protein
MRAMVPWRLEGDLTGGRRVWGERKHVLRVVASALLLAHAARLGLRGARA